MTVQWRKSGRITTTLATFMVACWLVVGSRLAATDPAQPAGRGPAPAAATPATSGTAGMVSPAEAEKLVQASQAVVDQLAKGKFDEVTKQFDEPMAKALTPARLQQGWEAMSAEAGPFQKQLRARVQSLPSYRRVTVTCQFKKNPVDVRVVWNDKGRISGLFLAPAGKETRQPALEQAARDFVGQLAAGQFAQAEGRFDATMKASLPEETLRGVWQGLVSQNGPFRKIAGTRTENLLGHSVVHVTARFEKAPVDAKVVFGEDQTISGLWFAPAGQ